MLDANLLVSEGIKQITPYVPGKPLEELEREYGVVGAVKMASNENPLGPSPRAIKALKGCLSAIHQYPDANSHALKEMLSKKLGIPQNCIIFSNGSNEIIELALKAFLRPGYEVIIPEPTFSLYAKFTQAMDGIPVKVPLKNFRIDLNAINEKIGPKTRIIFINNPNNPTGTIITKGEFEDFLHSTPENTIIVLDEAYGEFINDPDSPQGKNYLEGPRWIITLKTFSKVYGLAGLRIGYGLASRELTQYLNKIRQPFNVNSLAQVAACAALEDNVHFQKTLSVVSEGLRYLYQELDRLKLDYVLTQANFLMIRVDKDCNQLYELMLKEGVIVRPLSSFGYHDYIRVSVGIPQANERFINALTKILKNTNSFLST
ncbi:MAG: histidinol-phosphate transaminase [Deltaproteobacteria bacterium]|nr:histidinol-phosphate transaminase [Deltaproteobacteria bacterium]